MKLTQQYLKEILHYDESTGEFVWMITKSRTTKGTVAGYKNVIGYVVIKINKANYLAHRLAWLYVHGEWPPCLIDHLNGVRSDNRLCNLRPATATQNNWNKSIASNNKSGVVGVCWSSRTEKWRVNISVSKRHLYIGQFDDFEFAELAASEAREKFHGEFFNHGGKAA